MLASEQKVANQDVITQLYYKASMDSKVKVSFTGSEAEEVVSVAGPRNHSDIFQKGSVKNWAL